MKGRLKAKLSRIFGSQEELATTDSPPRPDNSQKSPLIEGLPNELLTSIFINNAECTPSSFLDVLSISHVCSHWRSIALNCPELWRQYAFLHSNHGSRGEDFSNTLLKRCGDLTLDVGWERLSNEYKASVSKLKQYSTLELECDNIHRFRSYSALATTPQIEKMTTILKNAPPIQTIEELTLDSGDRFLHKNFPHEIFSKEVPSLRTVTLRSCWLHLRLMRLDNLQTLMVTVAPHALPWAADEWISILKGCHSLIHFHLDMPTPFTTESERLLQHSDSPQDVVLPSLTHLDLHTPFFRTCHFLTHLSFPAVQKVSLSMQMYTASGPPYEDEQPSIQYIVQQLIIPSLSSNGNRLYVGMVDDTRSIAIGFSPLHDYALGESKNYSSDRIQVLVTVPGPRRRSRPFQVGATQYFPDIWTELTAVAPSITSLHASMRFGGTGSREFEAFLNQATSLNTLHEPGHAMLVNLATSRAPPLLALEKVVYAPPHPFILDAHFRDTVECLRSFASERTERGHPIKAVEFRYPKEKEFELLTAFRALVEKDEILKIVLY